MSFVKGLIENINQYKVKNSDRLIDEQEAYIPRLEDGQVECITTSYLLNGVRNIINQKSEGCIRLKYLRSKPMHPRKTIKYKSNIWDYKDLIKDNVIYPFMLFINGVFIPWGKIKVVLGYEHNYLVIDFSEEPLSDFVLGMGHAQIISLPANASYYDSNIELDEYTIFSFNSNGQLDFDNPSYIFKINKYSHIAFNIYQTNSGVNAFPIVNNTNIKLSEKNVMLFCEGYPAIGDLEKLKFAHEKNANEQTEGHNGPYLEFTTQDGILNINPLIKFDSNLLTIGDGTNEVGFNYTILVFINTKYTESADNITRASTDAIIPLVQNENAGLETPEYYNNLKSSFEMKMSKEKKYSENVADAIKTMLSYNSSFFNQTFLANSNVEVIHKSGDEFLSTLNSDGTVTYLRNCMNDNDEHMIILVNGELYKYYHLITTKNNKITIPVQDIYESDSIEIIKFKNVNNNVYDTALTTNGEYHNYHESIINDRMRLFSTLSNQAVYEYPIDGLEHFQVDYTLEYDDSGKMRINLDDKFYYNKHLKIAYENRFCHFRKVFTDINKNEYSVDLDTTFMYCNDYKKYLVFYNGRRLNADKFRLVLPVRPTTPFYEFKIYLSTPICEGDQLDIFYLPCLMDDISIIPEINKSGYITIDKSNLGYGVSTDLYMVWINGKKVPKSNIVDIDSTKMRVITDVGSINSAAITKCIPDIADISDVFKENEALWDTITSQLSEEEIYTLLGINGQTITNTENNVYENTFNIKSVMYELIREQYMMNKNVDITNPFVYDYMDIDTSAVEKFDEEGNAIIPTGDSNKQDNIDNVDRPWP